MARSGDSSPPTPLATLRDKLHSGVLPCKPFVKTWRGPGTGKPCDVCELPITPIEHEVEGDRLDGGHAVPRGVLRRLVA